MPAQQRRVEVTPNTEYGMCECCRYQGSLRVRLSMPPHIQSISVKLCPKHARRLANELLAQLPED